MPSRARQDSAQRQRSAKDNFEGHRFGSAAVGVSSLGWRLLRVGFCGCTRSGSMSRTKYMLVARLRTAIHFAGKWGIRLANRCRRIWSWVSGPSMAVQSRGLQLFLVMLAFSLRKAKRSAKASRYASIFLRGAPGISKRSFSAWLVRRLTWPSLQRGR